MAGGIAVATERRVHRRVAPEEMSWPQAAVLRPGQDVLIINLSAVGALVESVDRMTPGARADLQIFGRRQCVVRGRIVRCRVTALEPMRYEAAIAFEQSLPALGSE